MTIRSTPSPLDMSLAIADFTARRSTGFASSTDIPSLYSDSRTPIAIGAPVPTAANLSPRTDPIESNTRSEEHTSELQSLAYLVCRLLLAKKNTMPSQTPIPTLRIPSSTAHSHLLDRKNLCT